MKLLKRSLFLILFIVIIIIAFQYPKLTIITGYSAKNMSSSVFVAHRCAEFTDSTDNNFGLVSLADDAVDLKEKSASATVFGLMKRTAIFREGTGSVLINDRFDVNAPYLKPVRTLSVHDTLPYPYGAAAAKDSIFNTIDYTALQNAIESAFDKRDENLLKTRAILILYKNHIIAEEYAAGFDQNSLFLGWSMTKSILSTLYGILQKQGALTIDDPAPVAEWALDERAAITLSDLLQMNSGLEWDEDYESISDVTRMLFLEEDMSRSQREKEAIAPPGTVWNYSSGTSNLLSGILRSQFDTHQEYLDFPYKALIDKIGMHSMLVETDMSGNYVGSSYAWGTTRDWARYGLLYLNRGMWDGEQIITPEWIDYTATPAPNSQKEYGAHFWLNAGGAMPDVPRDVFYADGFQGQRVFIIPSHDMVVVRFGLTGLDFNQFLKEVLLSVKEPVTGQNQE
ncbi:serine hydrolase [Ascidiimonas aurantiaca]|uniref:serine hydrolase domain-containing protein n=1 Tax=Ascidiimonas aurantiaca TaxID=1685432 RepID=UPI0030ED1090